MPSGSDRAKARLTAAAERIDYPTLAELRYRIRRFLRTREIAARAAGVEPQQYLVLLQVKGLEGQQAATIGVLAERVQVTPHAMVQLVDRLVERKMVERRRGDPDRRQVVVAVRPAGEAVLRRLALHSLADLRSEGPALAASLRRLIRQSTHNEGRERPR